MHAKSDSEVTSLAPSSPRRPVYYVQSPSHHDAVEKMSYQSSPSGTPPHHHQHLYRSSPIHHSRESSTTRFSASIKNHMSGGAGPWRKMHRMRDDEEEEEGDEDEYGGRSGGMSTRVFYGGCFFLSFVVLFTVFSLILWGASRPYKPKIFMKSVVFENYNIHSGMDRTGVPTKMLSINSTVRMTFRNPATFFGVHVTATPLDLYYYNLQIAGGHMGKFYQSRKSERVVTVKVGAKELPIYGGGASLTGTNQEPNSVPFNLTFTVRSRAYVLGMLVKPKFYRRVRCLVVLKKNRIGKHSDLKANSCIYHD
ncbi:hypothetical protein QJS10_CPA01g00305 [Acorus calamus]|uniref:Late embryogenesis abundant protein LEA-2 subgroup domain-containing protein n=1 Tax=Acorus calamus TaxID=4465 RepID=A0AAV9FDX2_ACOCL|nr:hypothetical protein QJS10_CPA01g00305 [Acorus calamus]